MVTPNLVEAAALLDGSPIKDIEGMKLAATKLQAKGPEFVLVKGGHLEGTEQDSLCIVMQSTFG